MKIESTDAPKPIGPYSQAIKKGNTLYISGQIPYNAKNNILVTSNIRMATQQVMDNIGAILKEADMDFSNISMCSLYITDMLQFAEINEVYGTYFTPPFPARQTIEVSALPMNSAIEISAIAVE